MKPKIKFLTGVFSVSLALTAFLGLSNIKPVSAQTYSSYSDCLNANTNNKSVCKCSDYPGDVNCQNSVMPQPNGSGVRGTDCSTNPLICNPALPCDYATKKCCDPNDKSKTCSPNPPSAGSGGSCGSYDVTSIQIIVGVNPSGTCDAATIAQIRQWQSQHPPLVIDGIVGPQTAAAMGLQTTGSTGSGSGSGGSPTSSNGGQPACPAGTSQGSCPDPNLCYVNGLCLPKTNFTAGVAASGSLTDLIFKVIQFLLLLAGIIAVLMLIIGGFWYLTSAGNEEQAEKGRKAIINAIIGLVVIILSYAIVMAISAVLNGKDKLLGG